MMNFHFEIQSSLFHGPLNTFAMSSNLKLLIITLMLVAQSFQVESMHKTTVLISKTTSFHSSQQMSALERLDLKIIETFAKKYKLEIEYIIANETLNEIFGSENGFKSLMKSMRGL